MRGWWLVFLCAAAAFAGTFFVSGGLRRLQGEAIGGGA
jgi:hypothetical protein